MAERIERRTYTVREAATLLGVGKDVAYKQIKETGELAGVKAVCVSSRIVIPRRQFDAALGIGPIDAEPTI